MKLTSALSLIALAVSLILTEPAHALRCAQVHARTKVTAGLDLNNPAELHKIVSILKITQDPFLIADSMRATLIAFLKRNNIKATEADLANPKIINHLEDILKRNMATIASADKASIHETMVRTQEATLLQAKVSSSRDTDSNADLFDMNRGWGWRLLPEKDQAFRDPEFISEYLQLAEASGIGYSAKRSDEYKGWQLKEQFDSHINDFFPQKMIETRQGTTRYQKLEFNLHVTAFFQTGSDSNNHLYAYATQALHERMRGKIPRGTFGEILVFDSSYGAGRGKLEGFGFMHRSEAAKDYMIKSPHTTEFKPTSREEIARLEALEKEALEQIRKKANDPNLRVGGVLLEPIVGAYGVYVFRPEFMRKLRALCNELKIPIFADEILTGGGRTGKFFAFQHYEGFAPDFVTFGKGLLVSGIMKVDSPHSTVNIYGRAGMPTLEVQPEALLKSLQILKRIRDGKLVENAAEMGEYIVHNLKESKKKSKYSYGSPRGFGLLIFPETYAPDIIDHAMGRLMPYLTLTKEEANIVLKQFGIKNPTEPPAVQTEAAAPAAKKRAAREPKGKTETSVPQTIF